MVFQQFNLFPHLTVLDNCALAPSWVRKLPKKKSEEVAMEYLSKVKIADQAKKFPGQLSGRPTTKGCNCKSIMHGTKDYAL